MKNQIIKLWVFCVVIFFLVCFSVLSVSGQPNFQPISEKYLKDFFLRYLESKINSTDFQLSRFKIRGNTMFPPGVLELEIIRIGKGEIKGRINILVAVLVNGEEQGRIYLSGWVDRYVSVVCTAHRVPRGTILSESDVCLREINISKAPVNLVIDLNSAVGKRLKQSLKSGGHIRDNMLEIPPLIQKGDRVKLVAKKGGLTVVTSGTAKTKGGRNEQIKVENIDSKRIVVGRVLDDTSVEILF